MSVRFVVWLAGKPALTEQDGVNGVQVVDESFAGEDVDEGLFLAVLHESVGSLTAREVPYAAMGGIASSVLGRDRWTHDIDLFVAPADATRALEVLAEAGFRTQRTNEHWLFKAMKHGVLVDVLFKAKGELTFDPEMQQRVRTGDFKGQTLRVLAPEDLLVIKAIVHDEDTPRHWHDALGLIAAGGLDWDYLLHRALHGPRRVLSLLMYALSVDLLVPERAVQALSDCIYPVKEAS
jgi:hypothetical protein